MAKKKSKFPSAEVGRNVTTHADARPASELNLSPEEIAQLPDPNWVTEDDADAIIGLREERKGGSIPADRALEEILRARRLER
jgi:hypothetical protein